VAGAIGALPTGVLGADALVPGPGFGVGGLDVAGNPASFADRVQMGSHHFWGWDGHSTRGASLSGFK